MTEIVCPDCGRSFSLERAASCVLPVEDFRYQDGFLVPCRHETGSPML
jgi:hypothetical protein